MDFRFEDIIRSQLLFSFQHISNHSIWGIMFSMLVFAMLSFSSQIRTYCEDIFTANKVLSSVKLVGTIIDDRFSSRRCFSKRFLSVLHFVSTLKNSENTSTKHVVRKLVEICVDDMDHIAKGTNSDMLVNQEQSVYLTHDIYCKFSIDTDENFNEKTKMKHSVFTITLCSTKKTAFEIQHFLDDCVAKHNEFLQDMLNSKLYNFVYESDESSEFFRKIVFESNKTFDNVFFDDKEDLMQRIDFFETKHDQYKKFGVPHTFGILMHGEPGTGKTSTIKAIANYTKRHIISVPLLKVKDISVLSKLFLSSEIDGVHIPFNKRIYVFEEIDCNGLEGIVKSRALNSSNTVSTPNATELLDLIKDDLLYGKNDVSVSHMNDLVRKLTKSSSMSPQTHNAPKITLGGILELLDGIVETPGRMIIITTNHPEQLDAALVRPGRIDMNICFRRTTRNDIVSMFKLWFNIDLEPSEIQRILPEQFSHAEVCQLFFTFISEPYQVLKHLQNECHQPDTYQK